MSRTAGASIAAASGFVLLVYVATLVVLPRHVFWSPDEGGHFLQLASLRWEGGLRYRAPYGGQQLDPELRYFVDRFIYQPPATATDGWIDLPPQGSLWFALASWPFFASLGVGGIYVLPLLAGALCACLGGRLARSAGLRRPWVGTLLVGLATPIWFYSVSFWEHTIASLLALLALERLVAARPAPLKKLVVAGALLALAALLRIELLAWAFAVALAAWGTACVMTRGSPAVASRNTSRRSVLTGRQRVVFAVAALAVGVLSMRALPARHVDMLREVPRRFAPQGAEVRHLPQSIMNVFITARGAAVTPAGAHPEGPSVPPVWAVAGLAAVGLCAAAAFCTSMLLEAVLLLPALAVVLGLSAGLLLSSEPYRALHGLFLLSPFMVLWPYAITFGWQQRRDSLLTMAGTALLYAPLGFVAIHLMYAEGPELRVGLEWGQRYLLTAYPLLAVLSLSALQAYGDSTRPAWLKDTVRLAMTLLVSIAVLFQVRGLLMLNRDRQILANYARALTTVAPVVTDVWWLPAALAPLFNSHPLFVVREAAELERWRRIAVAGKVREFTFASFDPISDGLAHTLGAQRLEARRVGALHVTRFTLSFDGYAEPQEPIS